MDVVIKILPAYVSVLSVSLREYHTPENTHTRTPMLVLPVATRLYKQVVPQGLICDNKFEGGSETVRGSGLEGQSVEAPR